MRYLAPIPFGTLKRVQIDKIELGGGGETAFLTIKMLSQSEPNGALSAHGD